MENNTFSSPSRSNKSKESPEEKENFNTAQGVFELSEPNFVQLSHQDEMSNRLMEAPG